MKNNIITAVIILTGCVCAWGYLAAQPDGGNATPPAVTTSANNSLLEILEPSQEDFERCAKLAVDFLESISEEQAKTDIALHELFASRELPQQFEIPSQELTRVKNIEKNFGPPKLIGKKSYGENIIVLNYHLPNGYVFNFLQLHFRENR
jgi:hypothetical protein